MELRWTEEQTYIRIVDPISPNNNLGYISPGNGQLSVRPNLWDLINEAGLAEEFEWNDGPGAHGGVQDYRHTLNHVSRNHSIDFIRRVCCYQYIAYVIFEEKPCHPILELV